MNKNQRVKAIVTGATGMVGEGVLHQCLKDPLVESVLVVGRNPCGVQHSKLKEIIHDNFFDLGALQSTLSGYNACFFCLGVSSFRKSEETYRHLTLDLTLNFAKTILEFNPGLNFCYVSGLGTDSTEKGKIMWARVKSETENQLLALPFGQAYMFRPGYIHPIKGLNNTHFAYKILGFLYPLLKLVLPSYVNSLEELGTAMIQAVDQGYEKNIIECVDIRKLAQYD